MKEGYDWPQHPPWPKHGSPQWRRGRGRLFFRFLFIFGLMVMLILGGMAMLALLLTRSMGGNNETAVIVWLSGCALSLALPALAIAVAARAFRSIATPLADVMAAADAVAEGDLTVRVPEQGKGNQFAQLARSFNRMTSELEQADQLRRNLTADVAHELRTPLHIIQGNLEGVLDGVYEPSAAHMEATLEETRMLARLVDDLHTLSQAEAGQLDLRIGSVDVTELLADVHTSFSGQAASKAITFDISFAGKPSDLTIFGDGDRLDQVLGNLVVNALRFTPSGGRIQLHAGRSENWVIVRVADTGRGIPVADLPYVFNRFWRGDTSRTHTDGSGAGLGLAIASQLVEAHQGTISVTSTLGKGTEFTITLPTDRPSIQDTPTPA